MTSSDESLSIADGVSMYLSRNVVIRVVDEHRRRSKKFNCQRDLLLAKMKYFQAYLNDFNKHDDLDISVHCDVETFALLMEYMHQRDQDWQSRITLDNIASILVSSEFLQMEELVKECIIFISKSMQDFILSRMDFGCLSDSTITKIAESCTIDQLQSLKDPKDKILSKLQQKKVEAMVRVVQTRERRLVLCADCELLFLENDKNCIGCLKSKRQIGVHGELMGSHVAKAGWQVETFLQELEFDKSVSWIAAYWYILGSIESFRCSVCKQKCSLHQLQDCAYHPGSIIEHGPASNYSCCGAPTFSADEILMRGCRTKTHTPIPSDKHASVDTYLHSVSLPNIWEQICACEAIARMQVSSSSSEAISGGRIDVASLFISAQPRRAAANAIKCDSMSKKHSAGTDLLNYQRQCEIMQLQENNRVRCLDIARQLVNQRKKATR